MWIGPMVLGGLSLFLGLLGDTIAKPMVEAGMTSILAHEAHADLSLLELISHINIVLVMSILTIVAGAVIFYGEQGVLRRVGKVTSITWGPESWYNRLFDLKKGALISLAKWQTRVLQSGKLRYYLRIILITTIGLIGYALVTHILQAGIVLPDTAFDDWGVLVVVGSLAGIVLAAALFLVRCDGVLPAVAALGIVGYAVALIFVLFSAPDLAITQFSIETLTVILFVLVFYRLQRSTNLRREELVRETGAERGLDAIVALALGGLTTIVMLVVLSSPLESVLKPYFLQQSIPEAHGHNVVNVILVDFRSFDTMGEIVVLGVAALGVLALLKLRAHSAGGEE
jgi:multicomponent Na+:H+ antiporter subunit A